MLRVDGVVVSYFLTAMDIGVMALSVATAVVLGAVVQQVETNMAPTTMTMMTTNETHHSAPYTPPSDSCPREGKGKSDEDKGGGCHCGRQW